MFEQRKLENLGIEVTGKVEDEKVIAIVDEVTTKIKCAFPENNINYLDIYKALLDTPMYYAKIPQGLSEVNYYYENSSLYFSKDIDLENLNEHIYHECIHKLQERKDKKGNITRLGICEVNELTVKAIALNEGAIQHLTSKILNSTPKMATVYDITLPTKTEYYPILANLVSQLAYLLNENILIDSTINGNENFKIEIIDTLGESKYSTIEKNMNQILQAKNNILEFQKNNQDNDSKIMENKEIIKTLYINTQNTIYTSYFNNLLKRVENDIELSLARKKLYSYRSLIGTVNGYNDFNMYCLEFDKKVKQKQEEIKNKKALMVINDNIIFRIFRKIKRLFNNSKPEYNK